MTSYHNVTDSVACSQTAFNKPLFLLFLMILSVFHSVILIAQIKTGNELTVAGVRPPEEKPVKGKPLEHRRPYGIDQAPAFRGQTRAQAVITRTLYHEAVMTSSLKHPWGIDFLPDGRMIITEKHGNLRIVTQGGVLRDSVRGMPSDILYGGDAGLLDIAIDPDFTKNRKIYLTYAQKRENGSGLVVASAQLSKDDLYLENLEIIYSVPNTSQSLANYGSRLLFDKEGKLFVSTGDRLVEDLRIQSQWLSSPLGKILRINRDGTPAEGNPVFADSINALPEIWAYGLRNPQGLAFNPETGELWEDEHGAQGGDEVNIIHPGRNYGWPVIAYGMEYTWEKIGEGLTSKDGMDQPVYYWDPAVAPSGCTFYSGKLMKEWKNNLLIAALAGQHLIRLVIENNKVIGEERLLLVQHQRIRDIVEGPDGALWIITDSDTGRLIRVTPR